MVSWKILNRILICLAAGILLAWLMNEITFQFLKTNAARSPETIELVIPEGTAEKISRGESETSLPDGMVFVVGDTLTVDNRDNFNHQLGPMYVPARTKASMKLRVADKFSYNCSFVPDNTFGLDVQLPVTAMTRLTGAIFAGLPLGALIALYSFVIGSSSSKPKSVG